jgi:hypothetical protein
VISGKWGRVVAGRAGSKEERERAGSDGSKTAVMKVAVKDEQGVCLKSKSDDGVSGMVC